MLEQLNVANVALHMDIMSMYIVGLTTITNYPMDTKKICIRLMCHFAIGTFVFYLIYELLWENRLHHITKLLTISIKENLY